MTLVNKTEALARLRAHEPALRVAAARAPES
jgi:hypothetical protein